MCLHTFVHELEESGSAVTAMLHGCSDRDQGGFWSGSQGVPAYYSKAVVWAVTHSLLWLLHPVPAAQWL